MRPSCSARTFPSATALRTRISRRAESSDGTSSRRLPSASGSVSATKRSAAMRMPASEKFTSSKNEMTFLSGSASTRMRRLRTFAGGASLPREAAFPSFPSIDGMRTETATGAPSSRSSARGFVATISTTRSSTFPSATSPLTESVPAASDRRTFSRTKKRSSPGKNSAESPVRIFPARSTRTFPFPPMRMILSFSPEPPDFFSSSNPAASEPSPRTRISRASQFIVVSP